ncbi:MAG: hypothetical protein J7L96_01040 [Bacteroidales bacterium]|nr:hypothetical protein [Bacteroidales bacterium]
MPEKRKNNLQKISIVVHLISLLGLMSCFEFRSQLGSWFELTSAISLGLWMLSFYFSFNKTGLWKFTHTKVRDLDERELIVTSKAIRFGYSVLAIVTAILLFIYALTPIQAHVFVAAIILYLAHVLPAVYLGWKGEER